VNLVKEGFFTKYLEVGKDEQKGKAKPQEKTHETLILGHLNTIAGGFSGRGSSASSCKLYARAVISLDVRRFEHSAELSLCFTNSDLEDVFSHEDDPVVIFVITVGQKVHKVLIDQGRSDDVWFGEHLPIFKYPLTN